MQISKSLDSAVMPQEISEIIRQDVPNGWVGYIKTSSAVQRRA